MPEEFAQHNGQTFKIENIIKKFSIMTGLKCDNIFLNLLDICEPLL